MNINDKNRILKQIRSISGIKEVFADIENKICDIRNGDYTQESRQLALKILKDELIDKVNLSKPEVSKSYLGNIGE